MSGIVNAGGSTALVIFNICAAARRGWVRAPPWLLVPYKPPHEVLLFSSRRDVHKLPLTVSVLPFHPAVPVGLGGEHASQRSLERALFAGALLSVPPSSLEAFNSVCSFPCHLDCYQGWKRHGEA